MDAKLIALIVLYAVGLTINILDVLSTNLILQRGGREANPIVCFCMAHFGRAWWLPKLAVSMAGFTGLAFIGYFVDLWFGIVVLVLANVGFGAVVINNYRIAARLK